jgi:hypothetical protein
MTDIAQIKRIYLRLARSRRVSAGCACASRPGVKEASFSSLNALKWRCVTIANRTRWSVEQRRWPDMRNREQPDGERNCRLTAQLVSKL